MAGKTPDCGEKSNKDIEECCDCIPSRWVLGIIAFFGVFNSFSLRVNMSAAIVAMVDYEGVKSLREMQYNSSDASNTMGSSAYMTTLATVTESETRETCAEFTSNEDEDAFNATPSKTFLWDENQQGLALASYYYGYICAQLLAAWLGRKIGHVRVWGFCTLIASISTILVPAALEIGFGAFVALRIITGLFCGVTFPIMHGIWSMWAPSSERGKLLVLEFAGSPAGAFAAFSLSGYLGQEYGWQSVFYVTGAAGTVWAVVWWSLIYDSPAKHPRISEAEKRFIESSLGQDKAQNEQGIVT